jgi:3-methylcrotonyl-CoA carboxylase alpha subunit
VRIGDATFHPRWRDAATPGSITLAEVDGEQILFEAGQAWRFGPVTSEHVSLTDGPVGGLIEATMPGRVVSLDVASGAKVARGDRLLAIEAMKMEHVLRAPFDGTVAGLFVQIGDQVALGAKLALVERLPELS